MSSAKEIPQAANKKKSASSKLPPKKSSQPQALSTEYMQDDGSSSEGTSDADSNSDDDSLPGNPLASKPKSASRSKTQDSEGSSSSGSEDETDSEIEEDGTSGESEEQVSSVVKKTNQDIRRATKTPTVTATKPQAYNPPSGFEPASIDETPQISQLFSSSNLEGKEIWYITAPASVPLSSVEDLSLQAIEKRENVLSHNGDGYSFVCNANKEGVTKVMIPSSSNSGYNTRKTSISRVLRLQQTIPRAKFTSEVTTPAIKPVRQQPAGLRMRFHPISFEPEPSLDEEMPDASSGGFRKAGSISSSSDNSSDSDDAPAKPRKKSKTLPAESSRPVAKRKHSEGESKRPKHSSFKSEATANNRKLKKNKIQAEKKKTTKNQSASTEIPTTPPPIIPPKYQSSTRILPPKYQASARILPSGRRATN